MKTKTATHTPGPWIIAGREECDNAIRISTTQENKMKRQAVCAVYPKPFYDDTQEADARLIAAAPDLLAALIKAQLALAASITPKDDDGQYAWAMNAARAAISKAEGREVA